MKMSLSVRVLSLGTVAFLLLAGCFQNETKKALSRGATALNTYVQITVYTATPEKGSAALDEAYNVISDLHSRMDGRLAGSEIGAINSESPAWVKVSPEIITMLERAIFYSRLSSGLFDITIGPLTNLWKIGQDDASVPSKEEILKALRLVGYQKIMIDSQRDRVRLVTPGMFLNPGAIAKGYIADLVAKRLQELEIDSAIINLGGNVLTLGSKPDNMSWKVGLQNPFQVRGSMCGVFHVEGALSIVSSGTYERFSHINRKKYHHLLDPRTGFPLDNDLASVTILSSESIAGDALATATYLMGLAKGQALIQSLPDVEAVFITKDKKIVLTPGANALFTLTNDKDFTLRLIPLATEEG